MIFQTAMASEKNHTISSNRINQLWELLKRLKLDNELRGCQESPELKDFPTINEALTHTSAKSNINHERLEFLGDAVLRLAASEFIDCKFPNMRVGDRSALRAQLVSDLWLSQIGKQISIKDFLLIGPEAAGDASALSTLEAEATEALIGAVYESSLGMKSIHRWLTPYWAQTSTDVLSDPDKYNSKSALQELSQKMGWKLPNYETKEKSLQHGDPKRFLSRVKLDEGLLGEGWGSSRREAEQKAAHQALKKFSK